MTDANPANDIDEMLTAYLDGELTEEERRAVQHRLMDEPELRARLGELQSAWDLLDEMPETPVDQAFTKSTLELVALRAEQDATLEHPLILAKPLGWMRGIPLIVLLTCCGLLIGMIGGLITSKARQRSFLKNLPTTANYSGLRIVEEMSIAAKIAEIPNLEEKAKMLGDISLSILPPMPQSLNERKEWFEDLTVRQKSILWANEREQSFSPTSETQSARKLSKEIEASPDAKNLELAVSIVSAIYSSLTSDERATVRILKEGKADRLKQLFYRQLGESYAQHMDEIDRQKIVRMCLDGALGREIFRSFRDPSLVRRQRLAGLLYTDQETVGKLLAELSPLPNEVYKEISDSDRLKILATWVDGAFMGENKFSYEEQWKAFDRWKDDNHENYDLLPFNEISAILSGEIRESKRPKNRIINPRQRGNGP